jgi:NAD(P)-dependent dehydrogenase (short-subunit alcohol dehydrogenase family)
MIERAGRSGRFGACDVRSGSDHAALVASVLDEFGRLDIAVNNAGIPGTPGMMHTLDEAAFDEVIAVDLKGVWFGMQQQIAAMLRGDGGAVINVASLGGLVGVPGIAPYTAAKHGVIGLTKAAALEYADKGIRINAVCPAAVWTNITKDLPEELQASLPQGQAIKRFADPEEIGGVIAFLASDAASFMTGAAIPVDGGALAM